MCGFSVDVDVDLTLSSYGQSVKEASWSLISCSTVKFMSGLAEFNVSWNDLTALFFIML